MAAVSAVLRLLVARWTGLRVRLTNSNWRVYMANFPPPTIVTGKWTGKLAMVPLLSLQYPSGDYFWCQQVDKCTNRPFAVALMLIICAPRICSRSRLSYGTKLRKPQTAPPETMFISMRQPQNYAPALNVVPWGKAGIARL